MSNKEEVFLIAKCPLINIWCFPGGSASKESACKAGDLGSVPGLGRSPGEGIGYYPLQYSCLGNPMDRGAWWATVHEVIRVGHNTHTHTHTIQVCRNQKISVWRPSKVIIQIRQLRAKSSSWINSNVFI